MKTMKQFLQFFIVIVATCFASACSDGTDSAGQLVLQANTTEITAGGVDKVVFTVKQGDQDVTGSAKIYKGTVAMEGNEFTSAETGSYKFTAKYDNNFSNEVVVNVVAKATYKKKALLSVWTSTNCVYCPLMATRLKDIWLPQRAGQIVVLYYHMIITPNDDDPFVVRDDKGDVLFEGDMASWSNCIGGAPKARIDAEYAIDYKSEATRFDLVLKRIPYSGIAIESSVSGDKLHVKVKAKADSDYPYEPGLAVWLTESNLVEPQLSQSGVIDDYIHNYVVRASLCQNYKGITIPIEYRKAGAEYVYETDYTIPAGFKKENLKIVAYVYQNVPKTESDSGHRIDNAQEVKAGESIGYEINN